MTAINVFQRNWAFTDKDSEKPLIKTGSFGPCCVVTFTCERYAAMAHLDTITDVHSLSAIFKKFLDHSVDLRDVKAVVLGGWENVDISVMFCAQVICKIHAEGFQNVSTKNMFTKKSPPEELFKKKIPEAEAKPYYHFGAQVDARTGETFILKKKQNELDIEQHRQILELCLQPKKTNLPISQVI